MTQVEKAFEPNAIFIPHDARWKDNQGEHVDPETCEKVFIDGNLTHAECFTKGAWEEGKPNYILRDREFYQVVGEQEIPVIGGRIELLPDMWCVKEDETEYWDEEFRKKYNITRILGVYIFDRRKQHHLCELMPSYERFFTGSQWDAKLDDDDPNYDRLREEIEEEIRREDSQQEQWSYVHVQDVERSLKNEVTRGSWPHDRNGGYQFKDVVSVTTQDAIEEIRESMCNGDL